MVDVELLRLEVQARRGVLIPERTDAVRVGLQVRARPLTERRREAYGTLKFDLARVIARFAGVEPLFLHGRLHRRIPRLRHYVSS